MTLEKTGAEVGAGLQQLSLSLLKKLCNVPDTSHKTKRLNLGSANRVLWNRDMMTQKA